MNIPVVNFFDNDFYLTILGTVTRGEGIESWQPHKLQKPGRFRPPQHATVFFLQSRVKFLQRQFSLYLGAETFVLQKTKLSTPAMHSVKKFSLRKIFYVNKGEGYIRLRCSLSSFTPRLRGRTDGGEKRIPISLVPDLLRDPTYRRRSSSRIVVCDRSNSCIRKA